MTKTEATLQQERHLYASLTKLHNTNSYLSLAYG